MNPTVSPTTSTGFSYVGGGLCLDSSGSNYDYIWLYDQVDDINAAIEWCFTATEFKSELVGITIGNDVWFCWYDDDVVNNNLTKEDFDPPASSGDNSSTGSGPVLDFDIYSGVSCYRNEVSLII